MCHLRNLPERKNFFNEWFGYHQPYPLSVSHREFFKSCCFFGSNFSVMDSPHSISTHKNLPQIFLSLLINPWELAFFWARYVQNLYLMNFSPFYDISEGTLSS